MNKALTNLFCQTRVTIHSKMSNYYYQFQVFGWASFDNM